MSELLVRQQLELAMRLESEARRQAAQQGQRIEKAVDDAWEKNR